MLLPGHVYSGVYASEVMSLSVQCNEEVPFSLTTKKQDGMENTNSRLVEAMSFSQEFYHFFLGVEQNPLKTNLCPVTFQH